MRLIQLLVPLLVLAAAPLAATAGEGIHVDDPWIREAPPGASTMAGYVVVHNQGATPRTLVGARSAGFAGAMLHQSRIENGIAKMVHVKRIEILPGKAVSFAPGGYHIMLMKPERPYRSGDKLTVTLIFADGEALPIEFTVRKAR